MRIAIKGGGMYGCVAAEHLQALDYDVTVYEREKDILLGASGKNFHRLHAGFHYPLSLKTATKSSKSYDRFTEVYGDYCTDMLTDYWIAEDSRVNARQYEHFLKTLGRKYERRKTNLRPATVAGFRVIESVYDVYAMRERFKATLKIKTESTNPEGYDQIIDCTYSDSPLARYWNTKETTILLISAPLRQMAQTVLYGPYCGYIPDGDKFRFYHAQETSPRRMMEEGEKFFPELRKAVIHDVIQCTHVHPHSKGDERPYSIHVSGTGEIQVLSGKIAQSLDCARQIATEIEDLSSLSNERQAGEREAAG